MLSPPGYSPHSAQRHCQREETREKSGRTRDGCSFSAARHADPRESRSWKREATSKGDDWQAFRGAILALHPGASTDSQNTRDALDQLVSDRARASIRTRAELGEFNRDFKAIAGALIDGGRMSENEVN